MEDPTNVFKMSPKEIELKREAVNMSNMGVIVAWAKHLADRLSGVLTVRVQNAADMAPRDVQKVEITNHKEDKELQKVEVTNQIEVPPFPEINIPPVKIPPFPKIPDTVKVSNLKDIKIPETKIPKYPEFPKEMKISNLKDIEFPEFPQVPEIQQVVGEVTVSNMEAMFSGLKAVVDSIYDLKIELLHSMATQTASTITATPIGSHKEKINGTTLWDPDDETPTYTGLHHLPNAPEGADNWEILKHTYSDGKQTKIVRKKGAWSDRASLF